MDTEQTTTTTEQTVADAPVATVTAPPAAPAPTVTDPVAPASAPAAPSSAPAPTPAKRPSLGRIVVFREFADVDCAAMQDRAAIVTAVWSDTCVNLTVFDPDGSTRGVTSATLGDGHRSWSWPRMV